MHRRVILFVSAALTLAALGRAQIAEEATSALPLGRVLPAVASAGGVGGSFFRTSVQVYNPGGGPLNGRFLYHPANTAGSSADPGLDFTIPAGETVSYPDIVAAMGQSGLGSLDLLLPSASSSPAIVVARVYNDAGNDGTSGFTEEAINPAESGDGGRVLKGGSGFLLLPDDTDKFRFNIGVRTLSTSASIQFTVRDASGAYVGAVSKTYSATYFAQQEASVFLGVSLPPNGTIKVTVVGGSAMVYGATADNTTNDPSIQFARATF
jgi:hypothetical protein